MPSLGDSAVIILLGLLLFGPKGLAQIARQLGKLMGEFRRASNEFRMQMEEELRLSEQSDRQKEIAKIEAAAPPPAPVLGTDPATPELGTTADDFPPGNPDNPDNPQLRSISSDSHEATSIEATPEVPIGEVEPLPIAVSGDLKIMPPATGLPQPRTTTLASSSIAPLVDSIPHEEPADPAKAAEHEHSGQRPVRYTNGHTDTAGLTPSEAAAEESLHG